MKIKQIIYVYIFIFSLSLVGDDGFDQKELAQAIIASLENQNIPLDKEKTTKKKRLEKDKLEEDKKIIQNTNAEYNSEEKRYNKNIELKTVANQLDAQEYKVLFNFNEEIKEAKNKRFEGSESEYDAIKKKIKNFIETIPNADGVLEHDNIKVFSSFQNFWAEIKRKKHYEGKVPELQSSENSMINPISDDKIYDKKLNKYTSAELEKYMEIYNVALTNIKAYIKENHFTQDPSQNFIENDDLNSPLNIEQALRWSNIKKNNGRPKEEEDNDDDEAKIKDKSPIEQPEFQKHESIETENIITTKEENLSYNPLTQKTTWTLSSKIEKNSQTVIEKFKATGSPKTIQSLQNSLKNNGQENHQESPTLPRKDQNKNHFKTGLGLGLATGLGGILLQNHLFKSPKKKKDLLIKVIIVSSLGGLGAMSEKYFFKLKKYVEKKKKEMKDKH